jgi:hypothetical protein
MAFAAALRSFSSVRRLCRPGMVPSSWRRSCRNLRHRSSMCNRVCRPSLQLHLLSVASGTLRLKRKSLSPIFSVRICTRIALCRLLKPSWSWSVLLVGLGVYRNEVLPLVSDAQFVCHDLLASLCAHVLSVDRRRYSFCGCSATGPACPISHHPVASFAALSASSLPWIPTCAGIHWTSIGRPRLLSCCVLWAMSLSRYAPDFPFGFADDLMAAWLSV